METALRSKLKADAAVSALVGSRVDWNERPQKSQLPAIVLQLIADNRSQHMGGFDTFTQTRVQIDCFAETAKTSVELANAVIAAIVPASTGSTEFLRGFINDVRDLGENTETGFVHRRMVDAYIWHD